MSRRWNEKTGTSTVLRFIREDGGPEAWERFVHRYWRVIHGYAIASGLPPGDAEDLTQVVLTELVEKLPDFEVNKELGTFRTVLHRLVRWRVTDALRVIKRDRDAIGSLVEQSVEAFTDGPDEIFERAWQDGLMKAAMIEVASTVAPEHYQAFEMMAERDMPAKEVASMLGMSTASVYKAKSQISKQIRETFQRMCNEAD